jgi:hypothetical protein
MTLPYACLNCDEEVILDTAPYKLHCSEGCSQEAELHLRRCTKDGRIHEPDVAEAIQIRLAAVMADGYPKQARCIPPKIRAAVIARDNGQCRACGGPGTEIDHINGSSQAHRRYASAARPRPTPRIEGFLFEVFVGMNHDHASHGFFVVAGVAQ